MLTEIFALSLWINVIVDHLNIASSKASQGYQELY